MEKEKRAGLEEIAGQMLDILMPGWESDEHMADTPRRYAKWWDEFLTPADPSTLVTTFPSSHIDQMVVVSGIDTWSMCAHHLLPFSARVSIGYIAQGEVLGLSKFARIAHASAQRPTSQEKLVDDIATAISDATSSPHVAVTASGLHLCMAMRGVRTPATMTTSVTRGAFRSEASARAEWLALLRGVGER